MFYAVPESVIMEVLNQHIYKNKDPDFVKELISIREKLLGMVKEY